MSDQLTANFSQKGFTKNFLQLMKDLETFKLCCTGWLTEVITENSNSVIFSGKGTQVSPLSATVNIADVVVPTNGLGIVANGIGLGGSLVQNTTINTGNFGLTVNGGGFSIVTAEATTSFSASDDAVFINVASTNFVRFRCANTSGGPGSGAGLLFGNNLNHVGVRNVTSSTYNANGVPSDADANYTNTANGFYFASFGGGGFAWSNTQSVTGTQMVLRSSGNLILGYTGSITPTDLGNKLQINGSINLASVVLGTIVNGTLESDGTHLYFSTGGVRHTII